MGHRLGDVDVGPGVLRTTREMRLIRTAMKNNNRNISKGKDQQVSISVQ